MLILVFVMGLRKEIGVDYGSYERIFNTVNELGFIGYYLAGNIIEPGYIFLNYIISLIWNNYHFLLFITAFITIYFFYESMSYEMDTVSFTFAVFIFTTTQYFYYFGIVRLGIAASIVAYSLRFIKEGKNKSFILWVLFATMFHYSAVVSFILLFVNFSKNEYIKKSNVIKIIILIPVFLFLGRLVSNYTLGKYPRYAGYFDEFQLFNFSTIVWFLPFLLLFSLYYLNSKSFVKTYHFYYIMFIIRLGLDAFGGIIGISRMMWYFNISLVFLLPLTMKKSRNIIIKYLLFVLIIFFCFYYSYYSYFGDSFRGSTMIPYKNVFFDLY